MFPKLSIVGLAFPFFLAVNIAFCLFWLIFRIRLLWVPVLGMLVVGAFIRDYCPVRLTSGGDVDSACVCVLTYNVGSVNNDESRLTLDSLVRSLQPDIICLQEMSGAWVNMQVLNKWRDSLGYEMLNSSSRYIFSRHHILGDSIPVRVQSNNSSNGILACWISLDGDSVLVVNNHLESNSLTPDDKSEYKKMILEHEKEQLRHGGRLLAGKLSDAARYRSMQTDSLCQLIDQSTGHSIIVCGDFNDTPISYTYQSLARRLESAFASKGNGIGVTFNQRGFPVRIDHLFFSSQWECVKCDVKSDILASDHYPFVVYLRKKQQ